MTILLASVAGSVQAQFTYLSPARNSDYNDPSTSIILHAAAALNESAARLKEEITVEGSLSGLHDFEIIMAEQGRTMLLYPLHPFASGESVTVRVNDDLSARAGQKVQGTSWQFKIRNAWSAEDVSRVNRQMKQWYQENFGMQNNDSHTMGLIGPGFPGFTVDTNVNPAPGSVFWSDFNLYTGEDDHYCIIKSNGDSVYGVYDTTVYNNFDLNRNGYLTVYHDEDSSFVMLDSNYLQIAEFNMGNGYKADPHEFVIFPDGTHWMLAYDPEIVDMTVYDPGYQPAATVIGCVLQELDANNNVIFQWRSWDHYSILDGDHVNFNSTLIDYCHANAIDVDTDGNVLFSCRNMSEVTKINPATGDIIWRLGGLNNQFTFVGDSDKFSYQHDARRIANGHLTLFDNGNFHMPPRSYAKEYTLDEVNKTATLDWKYTRAITGGNVFSKAMGNVQRLPNGNTLICWGLAQNQPGVPKITELDTADNVVWEVSLDLNLAVYRAHRYEWEPCSRPSASTIFVNKITSSSAKVNWAPATNSLSYDLGYRKQGTSKWKVKSTNKLSRKLKNLDPATVYEFKIRSNCDSIATTLSKFTSIMTFTTAPLKVLTANSLQGTVFSIFPNPADNELTMQVETQEAQPATITFYGIDGAVVLQSKEYLNANVSQFTFDVSHLPSGFYLVSVETAGDKIIRKFVKQ